jgi:hypothetical protein
MPVNLSPKFSREDLAAFLKTLDEDRLMRIGVYASHEQRQRDEALKAAHAVVDPR